MLIRTIVKECPICPVERKERRKKLQNIRGKRD